jgi:hypothetical protein
MLCASALTLGGCLGPTYGTDKNATEQLIEDLSTSVKLGKKPAPPIQYNPRPGLVKPTDTSALPLPQENLESTSDQWPESPEERLARIRAEADEGQIQSGLTRRAGGGGIVNAPGQGFAASPRDRGDTAGELSRQNRIAEKRQDQQLQAKANPTQRRYLTDPPTEYRQPLPTAPYGDLGKSEASKERARKKSLVEPKSGWRKLVPWL